MGIYGGGIEIDIIITEKLIKSNIGCDPDDNLIAISTHVKWSDPIYYVPASNLSNLRCMSIEDYMIKAIGWESFLIALGRIEGLGMSILLDILAWENEDCHYTFFPEDQT